MFLGDGRPQGIPAEPLDSVPLVGGGFPGHRTHREAGAEAHRAQFDGHVAMARACCQYSRDHALNQGRWRQVESAVATGASGRAAIHLSDVAARVGFGI